MAEKLTPAEQRQAEELYRALHKLGKSVMADENSVDEEVKKNQKAFKALRAKASQKVQDEAWRKSRKP